MTHYMYYQEKDPEIRPIVLRNRGFFFFFFCTTQEILTSPKSPGDRYTNIASAINLPCSQRSTREP